MLTNLKEILFPRSDINIIINEFFNTGKPYKILNMYLKTRSNKMH